MSIDRMKKVTVVCEKNRTSRVFKRLFDLGAMEVADVTAMHGEADGALRHTQVSTEECDTPLQKIGLALGLVDSFAPEQQSFIKGLAPVPLVVEHGELERTLADFDLEAVFAEARGLDEKHRQNEHTRGEIRAKLEELALFQGVSAPIRDLRSLKRARALFGLFPQAKFAEAAASAEFSALIACEDLPGPPAAKNAPLRKVVAFAAENEPRARELLAAAGFEEIPLPAIEGKAADRIRDLEGDLSVTDEVEMEIRKAAVRLSAHRRALRLLKAFWEGRKRRILAEAKSMHGEWVGVLSGYVRERDLPALNSMLKEEFPGASCEAADPLPDDDVPVSLTETGGAQPFKLLTGMFGLLRNIAWTNEGAIDIEELPARRLKARLAGRALSVDCVDKFPKMTDYVVPTGIRIGDTARVRLGAYLGEQAGQPCTAPCKQGGYRLQDRKGEFFPVVSDDSCRMHILNGKELSMLPHVYRFHQAGIARLRIEGCRMNPEDLGKITALYRRAIDAGASGLDMAEIDAAEHEDITRGHYFRGVL